MSPSYFRTLKGQCSWWCDRIGKIPVSQVLTSDIQDGITKLYRQNRSKKTLTDYRNVALAIFELAERDRAITYNPAKYVDVPRNATKTTRFALTEEERNWITIFPHRARLAANLMMYAGLRRGELLALTVGDIEFSEKGGVIHVNKSIRFAADGNTPQLKRGGKTDTATRDVPLPEVVASYVHEQLSGRSPFEVLICDKDGRYMTESAFRRMWESYLSALNEEYGQPITQEKRSRFSPGGIPMTIRNITPHCLRHTYATMLHAAGVDVLTARQLLGHADIETTLSIYTHLDEDMKARDMVRFEQFLSNHVKNGSLK